MRKHAPKKSPYKRVFSVFAISVCGSNRETLTVDSMTQEKNHGTPF